MRQVLQVRLVRLVRLVLQETRAQQVRQEQQDKQVLLDKQVQQVQLDQQEQQAHQDYHLRFLIIKQTLTDMVQQDLQYYQDILNGIIVFKRHHQLYM